MSDREMSQIELMATLAAEADLNIEAEGIGVCASHISEHACGEDKRALIGEVRKLRAALAAERERSAMYRAEREGARNDYEDACKRVAAERERAEKAIESMGNEDCEGWGCTACAGCWNHLSEYKQSEVKRVEAERDQARAEIERLKAEHHKDIETVRASCRLSGAGELQAVEDERDEARSERDSWKARCEDALGFLAEARAALATARRDALEECAKLVESEWDHEIRVRGLPDAIRALANTKTEEPGNG